MRESGKYEFGIHAQSEHYRDIAKVMLKFLDVVTSNPDIPVANAIAALDMLKQFLSNSVLNDMKGRKRK